MGNFLWGFRGVAQARATPQTTCIQAHWMVRFLRPRPQCKTSSCNSILVHFRAFETDLNRTRQRFKASSHFIARDDLVLRYLNDQHYVNILRARLKFALRSWPFVKYTSPTSPPSLFDICAEC